MDMNGAFSTHTGNELPSDVRRQLTGASAFHPSPIHVAGAILAVIAVMVFGFVAWYFGGSQRANTTRTSAGNPAQAPPLVVTPIKTIPPAPAGAEGLKQHLALSPQRLSKSRVWR